MIVFHISSHRKHTSAPPIHTPVTLTSPSLPPPPQTLETVAIKQISLKSVPGRLSNIRQKEIAILKVTTTHITFKMAAKCTTLSHISQFCYDFEVCPRIHRYLYIIFCVVFVASPASSPSKGGGASPCIQLHPPLLMGRGCGCSSDRVN